MKKTLLTTSALAFAGALAAGQAAAQADKLSVSLSGYMEQWVGIISADDAAGVDGDGIAVQSDTEVHVRGSLESDSGLTFSVKVEFEGNGAGNVDESQATISGSFGQIVLGTEDDALPLMHYGNQDVGIGLNSNGDPWVAGVGTLPRNGGDFSTSAWIPDAKAISYYSPRISGVQFGATYIPNTGSGDEGGNMLPAGNDNDAYSAAVNLQQSFGEVGVNFSVGHRVVNNAAQDDKTTSIGLQVGFGAFGVDAAHAIYDMGNSANDSKVTTVGVIYSDGPMAASLGYGVEDRDSGRDAKGYMASFRYTLAPGVESRTSIFQFEDELLLADGGGLVTGIVISF